MDTITLSSPEGERTVQLLVGDLSAIPAAHAVDVLVVSAFPNNYAPTSGTLIGALDKRGLSVNRLAMRKEEDLRDVSSCWLSSPVERPDLHFTRLLCFEPMTRGQSAALIVSDVFRCLIPLAAGEPWISSVAMPLLAAGNQGESPVEMLRATLDAAAQWMSRGVSLRTLKIVVYEGTGQHVRDAVADTFRLFKAEMDTTVEVDHTRDHEYDLFVSYSHRDSTVVHDVVDRVKTLHPPMRVFMDRLELNPGSAWQQRIYEAMDSSRRVMCVFSPDYLQSKVCIEEFNIGMLRNREEGGVLIPVYLRSARLHSSMRLLQHLDVRKGGSTRLDDLPAELVARVAAGEAAPPPRTGLRGTLFEATHSESTKLVDALIAGEIEMRLDVRVTFRRRGAS